MSYTREQAEQVLNDFYIHSEIEISKNGLIFNFLNHKFPQLPERGWLIRDNKSAIVFRTGKESGYGLNWEKWEHSDSWSFKSFPEHWQPATKEEVQAMLEKEAKRRGLVEGVKLKCLCKGKILTMKAAYYLSEYGDEELMNKGELWGYGNNNKATCLIGNNEEGILLMKDGIWATPIDDLQERIDALVQEAKEKGKNLTIKID